MRTVLVCVRTPLAAHNVAVMAARLGLSAVVRTAASESEAMVRLAERACDVVLADTGLARPDPAAFVRRVLARAPGATVLLIGAEERAAAAAAVAAGARGLVQADGGDLMSGVVKAMLLLAAPPRIRRVAMPQGAAGSATSTPPIPSTVSIAAGRERPQDGRGERDRREADERATGGTDDSAATEPPAMVPAQRGDDTADTAIGADPNEANGDAPARSAGPGSLLGGADYSRGGMARTDAATPGVPGRPSAAGGGGVVGTARRLPGLPPTAGAVGTSAAAGSTSTAATGVPGTAGVPRDAVTPGAASIPTPPAAGAPQAAPPITLTEREMQVLIGMAEGKSNAEIGRELFVSEDTVKTHARRLFRKLGARDRAHAVAAGFRAGLVA